MQKVQAIGTVGKDLELRKTPAGVSVVSFSIAVNEKWKDKQGNRQESVEWINLQAWQKSADILAQYVSKGSKIYIEGKMKTEMWEDDGIKKYKTFVEIKEFEFLSNKQQGQQQPQQDDNGFGEPPAGFENGETF